MTQLPMQVACKKVTITFRLLLPGKKLVSITACTPILTVASSAVAPMSVRETVWFPQIPLLSLMVYMEKRFLDLAFAKTVMDQLLVAHKEP